MQRMPRIAPPLVEGAVEWFVTKVLGKITFSHITEGLECPTKKMAVLE